MELFKIIAMLCSISSSTQAHIIDKQQLKCQQYYLQCLESKGESYSYTRNDIKECVMKRGKK